LLQTHRDRLKPCFKDAGIELISQQFSKFVRAVREEPQFKDAVVNNANVLNGFSENWAQTQDRFLSSRSSADALPLLFPTLQL
jgi:hypothetical protein